MQIKYSNNYHRQTTMSNRTMKEVSGECYSLGLKVVGTGKGGRVLKADCEKALKEYHERKSPKKRSPRKITPLEQKLYEYTRGLAPYDERFEEEDYVHWDLPNAGLLSDKGITRLIELGLLKEGEPHFVLRDTEELDRTHSGWLYENISKYYHSLRNALLALLDRTPDRISYKFIIEMNKEINKNNNEYILHPFGVPQTILAIPYEDSPLPSK